MTGREPADALRSGNGPESGEELRRSEERFRLIVESAREYAIFMLDVRGVIISWNRGAERIKGYRADEIVGRHFSVFYSADVVAEGKPARELEIALRDGSVEDEGWRVRKDGTRFWANVVITALKDAAGNHIGFAKITRDMTDRRREEEAARQVAAAQLSESEERFASFAKHLPGLAWIKDTDGRYTYVNGAAEQAFGLPREQIYNHTDDMLFPPDTAAEFRRNDEAARTSGTGIQVVEKLRAPGGGMRHSIVSKFPLFNAAGEVTLIGGIAIDITDRVTAENALRQADRHKNEFLATLSHELRNPLAPLRNGIRLLRPTEGDPGRDRTYAMLERQLDHLVHLVDDLLDVARITRGRVDLRIEPVLLADVLADAVDAARPLMAARHQQFSMTVPDDPVVVQGDRVRLVQVMVNLLNNAAKYTPERGRIAVNAFATTQEIVIEVRDNGVGIPADLIHRIFEIFAQVDRTLNRSEGGLGIGLALARTLVEMHGGRIEAESEGANQGSLFRVRVPLGAGAPAITMPAAARSEVLTTPVRVLVVDDNQDGAESLVALLDQFGFDARASFDGPSALELLDTWRPTVMLLDIGLPAMDGYEVAKRIRGDGRFSGIRLIAVTGWGADTDRARTAVAGFDEHWVKPVDPSKLVDLLTRYRQP